MNEDIIKSQKRSNKLLKYILVLILLLSFLIFLQSYYLTNSDISIRNAAAESLNMDPNEFSWRDYSKVTKLDLSEKELSDLQYICKFKNLKNLKLGNIIVPKTITPKWKAILQKYHILKLKPREPMVLSLTPLFQKPKYIEALNNISKDNLIDLSPLKKLNNIESLTLGNTRNLKDFFEISPSDRFVFNSFSISYLNSKTLVDTIPFKSINPISNLKSLKFLNLSNTLISDITPVKNLKNLRSLYLSHTDVNDLEPIKNLKNLRTLFADDTDIDNLEPLKELKNLESLYISSTKIVSLEPIRGLINITQLEIDKTMIKDIEPLKELKNLRELWMNDCENITNEQAEDLKQALPNLTIYRHLKFED